MKEIYRCKKVYDGVTHAAKLYPNAYLIMIIIGTLKGNGAGFTRLMERLIRGVWTPTAMEFMQPSLYFIIFYFKLCFYIFLFQLHQSFFGGIDHIYFGQKNRTDFSTSRSSLLRNRDFLRLLQVVIDFIGNSRPFRSVRKFVVRPLFRWNLGQSGQNFGPRPVEGRRSERCQKNQLGRCEFVEFDQVRNVKFNVFTLRFVTKT